MKKNRPRDIAAQDEIHILAIAKNYQISRDQPDILNVWPIIRIGLAHQGHPRSNLQKMIQILEQQISFGWDEFGMDFNADHTRVEIVFLDQQASCPAKPLLKMLYDFRQAIS